MNRGYKVLHRGTKIPLDADGGELIKVMARAAHVRASQLLLDDEDKRLPEWDDLRPETKRFSADCMRAAFIALVVRCGADVQEIPELDDA
jgi:hypothetical protein